MFSSERARSHRVRIVSIYLLHVEFATVWPVPSAADKTFRTLEEECLSAGTLPSRAFGFGRCSHKWKVQPQKVWLRDWPRAQEAWSVGWDVIRAISFESGEERRISDVQDPGVTKWYPLIEWGWTRDDCVKAIERARLPVPPKSACFFCPSSKRTEVVQLRAQHPDLYARALAMEDNARPNLDTVKGLGRRWSWRDVDGVKSDAGTPEECAVCID
jgi:hypothetical protein